MHGCVFGAASILEPQMFVYMEGSEPEQVRAMEGIKEGPFTLHFGSPRRVHRCEHIFYLGRH